MPLDPVVQALLAQAAKAGIQGLFSMLEQAGMDDDQIDLLLSNELTEFKKRPAKNLPKA